MEYLFDFDLGSQEKKRYGGSLEKRLVLKVFAKMISLKENISVNRLKLIHTTMFSLRKIRISMFTIMR